MLQFLSEWLARDPARLGASLEQFVGHPGYGLAHCVPTWSGSSSCLAAATAKNCSVRGNNMCDREVGQPSLQTGARCHCKP
jgi:hypothetical protein